MVLTRKNQRGFTLLASAVCAVGIFGMAGLAIDVGRVYITKNEAQTFADSASLYAAMQLDGAASGLTAADNAVTSNANKWNFATTSFSGTVTEYSSDKTNWYTSATAPAASIPNMSYVRVTPVVSNLALFLLPVIGIGNTATVKAQAIAAQVLEGTSATNTAPDIFPYSPVMNVDYGSFPATSCTNPLNLNPAPTPPFCFAVGTQYTLKWPNSPALANNKTPCPGDMTTAMINRMTGMTSQWGEIQATSAATLYQQITDDAGGANVYVGQWVQSTTGDKGKEATALNNRSAQDTDQTDTSPSAYQAAAALGPTHANGRRLVSVIINSGFATAAGVTYATSQLNIGMGFAQFLLLPSGQYTNSGGSNNPWCAVYVGPAPGYATSGGGSGAANGSGIGFVRLVQ